MLSGRLRDRASSAGETPGLAATDPVPVASATAGASGAVVPPLAEDGAWTTWVPANSIAALVAGDGLVIAGGEGGLVVWERATRKFVQATRLEGLPHPDVFDLLARDRTLWIATGGGLARYEADDERMVVYGIEDGLDSDVISVLGWYPSEGLLLAGTHYSGADGGGLNAFDGRQWRPFGRGFPSTYVDGASDNLANHLTALLATSDSHLWVGTTNGLAEYDGSDWTVYLQRDGLPGDVILALFQDRDGVLWVGTNEGLARRAGAAFETISQVTGSSVDAILQAQDGTLWFGGGGFVLRYDAADADWHRFDYDELPGWSVSALAQDEEGALWLATHDGGLARFDGDSWESWWAEGLPLALEHERILAAPDGSLWFPAGSWIDRYDPAGGQWTDPELPNGDECCEFRGYAFLADGRVAGGSDSGLYLVGEELTHLTAADGLPSDVVAAVAQASDGRLWIGTDDGLAVYDGESVTAVEVPAADDLEDFSVSALLAAGDGTVWVGLYGGQVFAGNGDGDWVRFDPGAGLREDVDVINGFAETADGAIWLATNDGLYRYDGRRWRDTRPPGVSEAVSALHAAADGSLWVGFYESGVARYDGQSWERLTTGEGLISEMVYAIFVDSSGAVWFATDSGTQRYAP
jgi:ligand-binding sensor domain-containing protein